MRSPSARAKSASSHEVCAAPLDHAAHCLASGWLSPPRVAKMKKRLAVSCRLASRTGFPDCVIAILCPPAFLTFVWFSEVLAGCFAEQREDLNGHPMGQSLRDRNLGLAALAIDMAVPPLLLLVLVTALCEILGGIAFALGAPPVALAIPTLSVLLLLVGVTLAWTALGRDVLPLCEFLRLSLHAIEKLGFYHRMASGKGTSAWILRVSCWLTSLKR
jgi:hypothetical protein